MTYRKMKKVPYNNLCSQGRGQLSFKGHKAPHIRMSCLSTVHITPEYVLGLTRHGSAARLTTIISREAFRLWPA